VIGVLPLTVLRRDPVIVNAKQHLGPVFLKVIEAAGKAGAIAAPTSLVT